MSYINSSSKSALLLLSILGILIISTLVVLSSYFLRPLIEIDLKEKLSKNLTKSGIHTSITVHVSGRDIILFGSVLNKRDALIAENTTKKTWGVRHVKNNLLIKNRKLNDN